MTLSSALSNSITGLAASTRQLDTTANNIANATTEGYARRSVELSSISLNGAGGGVRIAGIDVAAVEALTNDRRRAEAEFGRFQTLSESLGTLEDLVGGVDDPGSLFNRYQAFETSLRDLADNPESSVAQLTVVTQAKAIVEGFDRAQTGVTKLREEADAAIAAEVSRLNVALEELKELNVRVQRDVAIDRDASESVAARQTVIDTIADIVPIRTKLNANGQLQVFTTGGAALVDLSATTFEFTNSPIVTADADYRGGAGSLSGISVNGIEVTPGVVAYGGLEGGTLAAWFEVRDGIGVDFQNQIDSLAADLIDRFDDPLVEPGLPVGDPGLFTDGGVANTGAPGLAGRLQVNALADPDAGGEIYRLPRRSGGGGGLASRATTAMRSPCSRPSRRTTRCRRIPASPAPPARRSLSPTSPRCAPA